METKRAKSYKKDKKTGVNNFLSLFVPFCLFCFLLTAYCEEIV
jgi:hypothetical protein